MMFKDYILVLVLAHILGDFYFQNTFIAKKKIEKFKYYLLHCVLYGIAVLLVFIPVWDKSYIIPLLQFSLSHALIDGIKILIQNRQKHINKNSHIIFLLDQALHIICIILFAYYLNMQNIIIQPIGCIMDILSHISLSYMIIIKFLLLLLGNYRPCNILIRITIKKYKPDFEVAEQKMGAGSIIGTLERYIITVFLYIKQYSLIGLVLTAKSIARYSQLNDDKKLAEYYLLGTLLSTIYSLVLFIVVIGM